MAENVFNSIRVPEPPKSEFNMSHTHRLSLKMGNLIPVMFEETIPGDYWKIKIESLIRFASLATPVMEEFDVQLEYFHVPYRLLWKGWEGWITGKDETVVTTLVNGDDINDVSINVGSLGDYLGLVPEASYYLNDDNDVNAFGFIAYQKIWFDWYRDQNHDYPNDDWETDWQIPVAPALINLTTVNGARFGELRKRCWYHDYFTSALPWAQKGDAVVIPFGEFQDTVLVNSEAQTTWRYTAGGGVPGPGDLVTDNLGVDGNTKVNGNNVYDDLSGGLALTSLLGVPSPTIDELNKAYKIQAWLQRNARAGSRYVEHVLANFAMHTEDYRLSRPEFLGSQRMPVIVSEVLQTSGGNTIDENGNLGDMAGRAITASDGVPIEYLVREHGCIMAIMSVTSRASYYQGIDKKFWRKDKFDYATPLLAQIGEQAIENRELYYPSETGKDTFGYTPRYSDWKYSKNRISGEFRTTLDDWQYARRFANQPALNSSFLRWSNDNRVFNVTTDIDNVYAMLNIVAVATRPLPFYGTPTTNF